MKCIYCKEDFDVMLSGSEETVFAICPHCGIRQQIEGAYSQRSIENQTLESNKGTSTGLKIYDYILAGISGLEFAWQLFNKLSGNSTRGWFWVFVPLFLVFGLLQHKKSCRIICSILLFGSILFTIILWGYM